MLAIIELGSKQYRVSENSIVYVDLTGKEIGTEFEIPTVLLVQNGNDIKIGQPNLTSAKVKATVLEEVKGPKIHGFKYKRRKNQHRAWGHRQRYHKLQITNISS